MRTATWVPIVALAAAAAVSAPAALAAEGRWYLGAGGGEARLKNDDSSINGALFGTGATATAATKDDNSFQYKLYVGYEINKYFAVEGGYFKLGEFSFNAITAPAGTLAGNLKVNHGWNLDVLGRLPLYQDRFSLFARVGGQSTTTTDLFAGTGGATPLFNPAPSKTEINYKAGAGAEYMFGKNVGTRLEWERYHISDGFSGHLNVDAYTLNLLYKF